MSFVRVCAILLAALASLFVQGLRIDFAPAHGDGGCASECCCSIEPVRSDSCCSAGSQQALVVMTAACGCGHGSAHALDATWFPPRPVRASRADLDDEPRVAAAPEPGAVIRSRTPAPETPPPERAPLCALRR
jgi:hypothetical protein